VGILLTCKEKGIRFRVQNISDRVRNILESTNLKKVFPQLY
jgi:anti-anti-sigma regulatory factor